ncbi:hypothetical protein [Streptomyces sp. NPDC002088]|uniref:hypothetical protein n=1 Tax=Streptomyces sp. NPDC002088 TaxID=3154665 RepID=UPI003324DD30
MSTYAHQAHVSLSRLCPGEYDAYLLACDYLTGAASTEFTLSVTVVRRELATGEPLLEIPPLPLPAELGCVS